MFRCLASSARTAVVLLALVSALFASNQAIAQGTDGMIPDPMSTVELNRYYNRLDMTPVQRVAAERAHDIYKTEYRALRDGEIAEFIQDMQKMNQRIPSRHQMEEVLNGMNRLRGRVEKMDEQFFDQLQPMLSPEQLMQMPRVRLARARARLQGNQMTAFAASPPDLSEIFIELEDELTPELAAAADAVLTTYEQRLTRHLESIWKKTSSVFIRLVEALEEAGLADTDEDAMMQDPTAMSEMMEIMSGVWEEQMGGIVKQIADVTDLNRRTYRDLAPYFERDAARTWRKRFLTAAYPEVEHLANSENEAYFRRAFDRLELDDSTRATVSELLVAFEIERNRLIDELTQIIDEERQDLNPFAAAARVRRNDTAELRRENMQGLGERIQRAEAEMTLALNDALGDDWRARLMELESTEATSPAQGGNFVATDEAIEYSGDTVIASAISTTAIRRMMNRLALDNDARMLLQELHRTYVDEYRNIAVLKALQEAQASRWIEDKATGTFTMTELDYDKMMSDRRAAVQAIRALDESFFDDVTIAVAADDAQESIVQRARRTRERQVLRGEYNNPYLLGETGEGQVDLIAIVFDADLPDAAWGSLASQIEAYEDAATAHLERLLEARLRLAADQEKWTYESTREQADGTSVDYTALQSIVTGATTAHGAILEELAEFNRSAMNEMAGSLESTDQRRLIRTYNRQAFPNVYEDPVAVDLQIDRAFELPGLEPGQSDALRDAVADYRPEYERLSSDMIKVLHDTKVVNTADWQNVDWQEWSRRRQSMERIRFDRDELCYRTANRLRAILSEEQLASIGGLPEPVERDNFGF